MRKVLYVCPSSGVGGAETFIKQSFINRNQEQVKNHYLLFRSGPLFDFLTEQNANVFLLNSPPRLSKWRDHKKVQQEIMRIINQFNIDLVHSTMAYSALFSARACRKMQTPHVWFQHGPASGWMDRFAALLPHQGLVVNSHYTGKKQRELENPIRFFTPRKHPIEKILLGTDLERPPEQDVHHSRTRLLAQHQMPQETILIAMMCRVQKWKGVHLFAEALRILKQEKLAIPFYGIVWGEAFKNDDYFNDIKKDIAQHSIPLDLAGSTSQVSLSLSSIDLIVNASIQPEPFGLSIVEGMMMGAVPIVPNEGGPIEIVKNGDNGMVFSPQNAEDLAKQMKKIILDSELRKKIASQARETAQTKFNALRAIQHLERFHENIITSER